MRVVVLLFLLIICYCLSIKAQNKQFLYGFQEIPQSLLENPGGEVNFTKHISIPFLSGIYIDAGTNNNLISNLFSNDRDDIGDKYERIIHQLSAKDFISVNEQLDIINIGYKLKNGKDYINFGLYQELDLIVYHPKDIAILYYQGNKDANGNLDLNRRYQISDINYKSDVIGVFHVGISRRLNRKLTIGARAKVYSGAFNVQSLKNKGTILTRQDLNNNPQAVLDNVYATISRSGLTGISKENFVGTAIKNTLSFKNFGLGFDIGFTYHIKENITLSGSVLDIGFINYAKDVTTYKIKGNAEISSIDLLDPLTDNTQEDWQDVLVEVNSQIPIDTLHSSYLSFKSPKVYTSFFYKFGRDYGNNKCTTTANLNHRKYLNEIGVQLHSIFRPIRPQFSGSLFYTRRLSNFLKGKVTYTINPYSFYNIGLGLSTQLGKFNFYVAADNLLGVADIYNSKKLSVSLGMNLIFK